MKLYQDPYLEVHRFTPTDVILRSGASSPPATPIIPYKPPRNEEDD